ncbi:MAG TPA: polymer-forming cytoskeletal protein [Cellvibrionaceae bacterium]
MGFANTHTLIAKGTKILGDLYFAGDLQIEGEIQGNVYAEAAGQARVVVAEHGIVLGEIHGTQVVINGQVKGDVYSSKHLELAAKAQVTGNVYYQLIEMVKGAQVNGSLVRQDAAAAVGAASGKKNASEKTPA